MKKTLLVVSIIGITLLALGVAGFAYAQTPQPPTPETPYGKGRMGGFARGMLSFWADGDMHESLEIALADATGLSEKEIEERFEAGETHLEIALAEGMTEEEFFELMNSVHSSFLDEAVASGLLTEEQAEWMKERMSQKWGNFSQFGRYGGGCGGHMYNDDFQPRWGGMSY